MPAALRKTRSMPARTARSVSAAAPNSGETARVQASRSVSPARVAEPRPRTQPAATRRPELHVIQGRKRQPGADAVTDGFQRLFAWVTGRRSPFLTVVVAAAFLGGTLLGTLALRTQMVEYSFESARVNRSIAMLTQDAQTYQSELDRLEAQLPERATQMGMVPQQGTLSIDLQGYQPPADDEAANAAQQQTQQHTQQTEQSKEGQ